MFKVSIFLIFLALGIILKKVSTMAQAASLSVSIDAQHPKGVRFKKERYRHPTQHEFQKNVDSKITELKNLKTEISSSKDKVESEERIFFDLRISCAERWIETLSAYKATETRIDDSYNLALQELKAAKNLTILRPYDDTQERISYQEKDIEKLDRRFNQLKNHKIKLNPDDTKAVETMIFCAGQYIELLKNSKYYTLPLSGLIIQAMNYVNKAERFLDNREEN